MTTDYTTNINKSNSFQFFSDPLETSDNCTMDENWTSEEEELPKAKKQRHEVLMGGDIAVTGNCSQQQFAKDVFRFDV